MLFDDDFRNKEYLDHKMLGDLAFEIGEYDKAIKHYKKQLEIMSEIDYDSEEVWDLDDVEGAYIEYELYEEIAKVYECKNDYKNSIKYVNLMIEDDENRNVNKGDSVIKLANLYNLNNQKEESIKILDELLNYEKKQIEKEYDGSYQKEFFDNTYEKEQYLNTCYELIKLLQDTDKQKSIYYMNLALDMYNKHGKNDLGIKMVSILEFQSEFYKTSIESNFQNEDKLQGLLSEEDLAKIKCICNNSISSSKIYLDEYEYEKSKEAILEGVNTYKKYKINDYKLEFYLKYQLAKADSELNNDMDDYPVIFEEYMEAFKILEEHDFFDEYSKNMILIELARYNIDYDLALQYKRQCDYLYIAEYNIKHSEKKKVAMQKEYYEAGKSYFDCKNYDMAINCYEKILQNLLDLGLFDEEEIEFEDENIYYDSFDKSYFGYEFYVTICESIAEVYKEKDDLDKELHYLNNIIKCFDKYYYIDEFNRTTYLFYTYIFEKIIEISIKKQQYEIAANYVLLLIGIYNSPNLEKSINEKFEDIDKIRKLFEIGEIKEFILSEKYKLNLENKWLNSVKDCFEKLLKIAKLIEDNELMKISEQKIKILKDIPFDLDI